MRTWLTLIWLSLILPLTACGFTPVYGTSGGAQANTALEQIAIGNIPDREGQDLRNRLIDRFYHHGRPTDPLWSLEIEPLKERASEIDITKDSDATRGQLRIETSMTLHEISTGKTVLHQTIRTTTGYNIVDSRFATRVTEDAARKNALEDIARQIESRIAAHLSR